MRILRGIAYVLGALALIWATTTLAAMWVYRDIPADVLEGRYANEASRFMNLEGVRVHYRDEGSGPPLVLIHANFASLLGWEPWVEALKDRHRVIRFDMTSHGLTGPDPTGDYSLERTIYLAERFIDTLGLENITVGGTSLGGTVAMHIASRNPDLVERLILLSPGALESGDDESVASRGMPPQARVLEYILPRALPAFMLSSAWGKTSEPPEELIDRWHDLWLLEGQRAAQLERLGQYEAGDLEGALKKIRTPTLLLWGEANPQAKIKHGYELRDMLANADVQMLKYPDVGHMAVQEAGAEIARDVRAWLEGTLDINNAVGEST